MHDHINLDALERRKNGSTLRKQFSEFFGTELIELTKKRRVFLVAPSFHEQSIICVGYLSEVFAEKNVEFVMLQARKIEDGFSLNKVSIPRRKMADFLPSQLGISTKNTLAYVLIPGARPVVWRIGKMQSDGSVKLDGKGSEAVKYRSLNFETWLLKQPEDNIRVDLSESGKVYQKKSAPFSICKTIGGIESEGVDTVFAAEFSAQGAFEYFTWFPSRDLHSKWILIEKDLPGWRAIAELAAEKSLAAKKR